MRSSQPDVIYSTLKTAKQICMKKLHAIACDRIQLHAIACDRIQLHAIAHDRIQLHAIACIQIQRMHFRQMYEILAFVCIIYHFIILTCTCSSINESKTNRYVIHRTGIHLHITLSTYANSLAVLIHIVESRYFKSNQLIRHA
jgi:hypothetical protein